MKMKGIALLSIIIAVGGCSHNAADPASGSGAAAVTSQATNNENPIASGTKTVNAPLNTTGGQGYRIVPKDPSKFPANAAGGDH